MTWTMADRQEFVDLMSDLERPETLGRPKAFLADRSDTVVSEAGAIPGVDQVRAGVIRALRITDDPRLAEAIAGATLALEAFEGQLAQAPPTLLQRRHPAWVGLAALEAGWDRPKAFALAKLGFETYAGPQGVGDVLWAMAEAADDVGWSARHRELLLEACTADFLDDDQQDQVRLLWALSETERDPTVGRGLLEELARGLDVINRVRIHAFWVVAALARDQGDDATARQHLLAALALVDESAEPDVAQRLREAL